MFEKITTAILLANAETRVEVWVSEWLKEALETSRLRKQIDWISTAAKCKSITIMQQIEQIEAYEKRIKQLENALAWHKERVRVERRDNRTLREINDQLELALTDSWPAWLWFVLGLVTMALFSAGWGVELLKWWVGL